MQIHQPVSHGLLYSLAPKSYIARSLSDNSIHDEFDWEEASEYAEESISNSVLSFLKEMDGE
jgi:hypothetical protein